ncbi:hypothetical protein FB45DRAFT_920919 [Roridomyces roridus]|uniref:DUF6534 domain-containing protein n=1 Tax=Roridomyces roridus TaxID=1738132 RepID=A0AAD7BQ01_9AGAR|nr:hypothetical protein FB45DRAFT_920919 [Roridomyces roridus]
MSSLSLTIGCLLIASWANIVLFTLEAVQAYTYFRRYPKDTCFNRVFVISALASDTMTVIACLSVNYLYLVTHWGSETYIQTQPSIFCIYILGTGITATIVQIWLTRMVFSLYVLTKQWIWPPIIVLFILAGLAGSSATAIYTFINTSYSGREAVVKFVTLWLSGCAAADIMITGLLVWTFRTLETDFVNTAELLHRLSLTSLRNGSITTLMTIINIVVFKLQPQTNAAVMIEMTIGRIYTLSMLANLNNRTNLAEQLRASAEKNLNTSSNLKFSSIKFSGFGTNPTKPERAYAAPGTTTMPQNSTIQMSESYLDPTRCRDSVV